jgi:hypothetical protein
VSLSELHFLLLSAARHPKAVRLIREGLSALARLPYRRLICLDAEFRAIGDILRTWCICALDLRTGEHWKLWLDDSTDPPPFPVDKDTLFIAFVAGAEVASFLARKWPFPARIFDVFQEFRAITNTGLRSDPRSLEDANAFFHLFMIAHAAKKTMQKEAMERVVWPDEKKRELVDYCWEDVLANARLFLCVLAEWLRLHRADPQRALYFALQRGELAGALAESELLGIPFSDDWSILKDSREAIFTSLVEELSPALRPIFRGGKRGAPTFSMVAFRAAMEAFDNIPGRNWHRLEYWPLTETGELSMTDEVLDEMLGGEADLDHLVEVIKIRSKSALLQCDVGADMRARTPFFPGSTVTGRCAPKASKFIFAAPKMFRWLIQSREPGWVVVSLDYAAQESWVIGQLARSTKFLAAYSAGDVHLECARLCGMIRPGTDKATEKRTRKQFKTCNLAVVYQAGLSRIAGQLAVPEAEAGRFMAMHRQEFWDLHDYVAAVIDQAMHDSVVVMQDGWRRTLSSPFNRAAAANAPVQGTAAAIYRLAVIWMHRAGLPLIATVHDSFVFECRIEDAGDLIETARRIMVEAGAHFLPGVPLKVDVSASAALPHLPYPVEPLADPELWTAYQRHLERAAKAKRAA